MRSERGRYETGRLRTFKCPEGLQLFENDGVYREWLARNPDGYVVNVRRMFSPNHVVLHRAAVLTCPTLGVGGS